MHLKPEDLSLEEFLSDYGLKNIGNTTIWRWMKLIGYEYNERRKSYYSDRHEHEENIEYRKKFIKKYFMLEKRAHRWVHIVEEEAKRLEQDEDNPLLANVYHEFVKENKKY